MFFIFSVALAQSLSFFSRCRCRCLSFFITLRLFHFCVLYCMWVPSLENSRFFYYAALYFRKYRIKKRNQQSFNLAALYFAVRYSFTVHTFLLSRTHTHTHLFIYIYTHSHILYIYICYNCGKTRDSIESHSAYLSH